VSDQGKGGRPDLLQIAFGLFYWHHFLEQRGVS
jgi:hypothetical protein